MRKIGFILALSIGFIPTFLLISNPTKTYDIPSDYRFELTSIRVIDGDTIEGDVHLPWKIILRKQKVRFLGVDTWEMRGRNKKKGKRAKTYTALAVREGRVWIVPRRDRKQRDGFGRILAYVYTRKDKRWYNLGSDLKKNGHAKIK